MFFMVHILIDERERNVRLVELLSSYNITIDFASLPVGDYIVSKRVAIERKTISDFVHSIENNRLFDQLERLSNTFLKPILIIEGEDEPMLSNHIINGILAKIYLEYNTQVIRSYSEDDTADIIYRLAKREQEEKENMPIIVGSKRAYSDYEFKIMVLSSFPFIGQKTAKKIIEHFKTLKNFANANLYELMKIEGIGKKKAERIIKLLNE